MVIKVPSSEKKITTDDPRRWGKHLRCNLKWRALALDYSNPAYREGYDRINWKVKRADDPFAGVGE